MNSIRVLVAFAAMSVSAAFAGPLHAMGPAPTEATPVGAAAAQPARSEGVNSVVLSNLATATAATSAHNKALLSRGDECRKRVHDGVIKPSATAQMHCLLSRD